MLRQTLTTPKFESNVEEAKPLTLMGKSVLVPSSGTNPPMVLVYVWA